MSLRETKVKRVLDMLKAEKLSFINLVDTVFTSDDPTIRLYADKFLTSPRASPIMTSIVRRSKRGLFDNWILSTASRILSRQLERLRDRFRMPTSTYSTSSILGWSLSSTEQLFKSYAPSMLLVFKGLASGDRQQRRELRGTGSREQTRQSRGGTDNGHHRQHYIQIGVCYYCNSTNDVSLFTNPSP